MSARAVTKVVHRCWDAKEDRKLDLSECQLAQIPNAVYHLVRNVTLETCNLSTNVLKKIPGSLGQKFSQISELNLSNNCLSMLPDELIQLTCLKKLDISYNNFALLPKVIFKLVSIATINAEKNYITVVDVSELFSLPSLTEINLKENPLIQEVWLVLGRVQTCRVLISPFGIGEEAMDTTE